MRNAQRKGEKEKMETLDLGISEKHKERYGVRGNLSYSK